MARKSKKALIVTALLVIALAGGMFGYLNKDEENVDEIRDDTLKPSPVTTNHGTALPSDFPESFPLYPSSQITSSYSTESSKKLGMSVNWETSASSSDVIKYFSTELRNKNWSVDITTDSPNIINFSQDKMKGFVIVADEDNIVSITVALSLQ